MVDFLDELIKEGEEEDGTKTLPTNEDLSALTKEIEELKVEKAGLLKGVKTERSKRQEISGRLNQLTDTVQGILSQREANDAALASIGSQKDDKLPVTWTEDGEGFIHKDQLEELISPMVDKIQNLEQQLQTSYAQTSSDRAAQTIKEAIVGEDEKYEPAYRKYTAARKWVTDQVADFAQTNGINRQITATEALDNIFDDTDSRQAFETRFPGMQIDDVLLAEDSKYLFRRMLTNVSDALGESKTPDTRFQKVLQKPSGLGDQANAKAGNLSIADKVSSLSATDITKLSDEQAEALLRAIGSEEKEDGVKF